MAYSQDYIIRQIEMITQFIAKAFFKKESAMYEIEDIKVLSVTDELFLTLKDMAENGDICKAEDLLFQQLDLSNDCYFEVALDFYNRLSNMSDEFLQSHNFSREEIRDSLKEISKMYGINNSSLDTIF